MTDSSGLPKDDFVKNESRLCGDLTPSCEHLEQRVPMSGKGHKMCVVCGETACHVCMKCVGPEGKKRIAMHIKTHTNNDGAAAADPTKVPCFFHCHTSSFFGLAKNDHALIGKRKRDCTFPTKEDVDRRRKETKALLQPVVTLPDATDAALTPQATAVSNSNGIAMRNGEQHAKLEQNN